MNKLFLDEQKFILICLGATIIIALVITLIIDNKIKAINQQIHLLEEKYGKVNLLYEKLKANKFQKKRFLGNILLFVQELENVEGIKEKIVSVKFLEENQGANIMISGLTLNMALNVFKKIEQYSNIKIKSYTLKKNFSSSNLLDLDLTLGMLK